MDNTELAGGTIGTFVSAVGASLSVTEIQAIVSIVATVIGLIITITTGVIIPVVRKYKAAKKDGKITPDEVKDMVDTAKDGISKIKTDIDKNEK